MIDMLSLQEALYLTWIPKLVNKQEAQNSWMAYPSAVFFELGLNQDILATSTTPIYLTGLPQNMHSFRRNVLQSRLRLRRKYSDSSNQVYLNSAIWNNSHFQYKHKNLHMKDWITNGIYKIKDVLHNAQEALKASLSLL